MASGAGFTARATKRIGIIMIARARIVKLITGSFGTGACG
jgi:hypothetical protein